MNDIIDIDCGQGQTAGQLFGAAEALREAAHSEMTGLERCEYEPAAAQLRTQLGEADFAQAWAAGRALSPEAAMALALDNDGSAP